MDCSYVFEKLLLKAKEDKSDVVFCDFYFAFPDKLDIFITYNWEKQGIEGLNEYLVTQWTTVWGNIQKRKLYDDNNLRCPININYCEDFHLMARLCYKANKISKVSEPLCYYRQQPSSIMHNLNETSKQDVIWVYNDIIKYFKENRNTVKWNAPWLGVL